MNRLFVAKLKNLHFHVILIDFDEKEETVSEKLSESPVEKQSSHFSDPLMEALFGLAPSEPLEVLLKNLAPKSTMQNEVLKGEFDLDVDIDMLENSTQTSEIIEQQSLREKRNRRRYPQRRRQRKKPDNGSDESMPTGTLENFKDNKQGPA